MSIRCPYCDVLGKIKRDNPPEKDFQVTCPKCKHIYLVALNKRDFYRDQVSIPVYFSLFDIDDPLDKGARRGKIRDLSRTGLSVESNLSLQSLQVYKEEDILTLLFSLSPEQGFIKVKGKIARIIEDENKTINIGIQFIDLDPHHNKLIGFYLMK